MSLRDQEGYLLIDHRNASANAPDELMIANGLPPGSGRGLFESATFTCKHCQVIVVLNPDRSKPRNHCRGCDHLICDGCAAIKARTGLCRTFDQVVDEYLFSLTAPKEF